MKADANNISLTNFHPNTDTHTHTHTQREREREGRGESGNVTVWQEGNFPYLSAERANDPILC